METGRQEDGRTGGLSPWADGMGGTAAPPLNPPPLLKEIKFGDCGAPTAMARQPWQPGGQVGATDFVAAAAEKNAERSGNNISDPPLNLVANAYKDHGVSFSAFADV